MIESKKSARYRRNWGQYDSYENPFVYSQPQPQPKTIYNMTPRDAANHKKKRLKELHKDIKLYQQYILNAEAEIEEWEEI